MTFLTLAIFATFELADDDGIVDDVEQNFTIFILCLFFFQYSVLYTSVYVLNFVKTFTSLRIIEISV